MADAITLMKDRIDLDTIPFTDRNSRLLIFRDGPRLKVELAEWGTKRDAPPILRFWLADEDGIPLDFQKTSFPHRVECQTTSGKFVLAFADEETLLVQLSMGKCRVYLETASNIEHRKSDWRGGVIRYQNERPLTIAYTTNAHLIEQTENTSDSDDLIVCLSLEAKDGEAIIFHITRSKRLNRYMPVVGSVIEKAKRRWKTWFDEAPNVPDPYQPQYYFAWWVLRINLIRPYFHPQREGMVPSKKGYVGVWNWDSYFHAIAYRHLDMELAKEQFRILFDHQLDNGMIPDVIHDTGVISHTTYRVEADITKPPLTAWAIWKLYELDHDLEFLREVYDPLVRSQAWWFENRDVDGTGLCEYQNPYSSGLDDSPLFDQGLPVESPDLTAYLILQYDILAQMATAIGILENAARWTQEADVLTQRLIDLRWDEDAGYFPAWHNDERVDAFTPFNLFPLITGRMPKEIADRLVSHLTDSEKFWAHYPVPTVSQNDPSYDPLTMWRGPVWVNINYLLIDGLKRAGYPEIASQLRQRTIEMVQNSDNIFEYYHPETGVKPPRAASTFGWASACYIDLVLQAIADESLAERSS